MKFLKSQYLPKKVPQHSSESTQNLICPFRRVNLLIFLPRILRGLLSMWSCKIASIILIQNEFYQRVAKFLAPWWLTTPTSRKFRSLGQNLPLKQSFLSKMTPKSVNGYKNAKVSTQIQFISKQKSIDKDWLTQEKFSIRFAMLLQKKLIWWHSRFRLSDRMGFK